MASFTETILARIDELLMQPQEFLREDQYGRVESPEVKGHCIGWITAASFLIQRVCSNSSAGAYAAEAKRLQESIPNMGFGIGDAVKAMVAVLSNFRCEVERGLVGAIENRVTAETYDDLIDHAQAYLDEGRKDPAGAIAGVIFEDTMRKLCAKHGIDTTDKTLDPMINALKGATVLSKMEGKEALTAQGVRTSATHARWHEFNDAQVRTTIEFTRRMIREKLAG